MRFLLGAKVIFCASVAGLLITSTSKSMALEPGTSKLSSYNCAWISGSGYTKSNEAVVAPTIITTPSSGYYVLTRNIFVFYFSQTIPLGNEIIFFNTNNNQFYVQYPVTNFGSISGTFTGSFVSNSQGGHSATLKLSCGDTLTVVTTQGGS